MKNLNEQLKKSDVDQKMKLKRNQILLKNLKKEEDDSDERNEETIGKIKIRKLLDLLTDQTHHVKMKNFFFNSKTEICNFFLDFSFEQNGEDLIFKADKFNFRIKKILLKELNLMQGLINIFYIPIMQQ
jgi:hypothetical protein